MTLNEGEIRGRYRVTGVNTEEKVTSRLRSLGINEKTSLKVLNKKRNGSMVIMVRGTRLALGKEISLRIEIDLEEDGGQHE